MGHATSSSGHHPQQATASSPPNVPQRRKRSRGSFWPGCRVFGFHCALAPMPTPRFTVTLSCKHTFPLLTRFPLPPSHFPSPQGAARDLTASLEGELPILPSPSDMKHPLSPPALRQKITKALSTDMKLAKGLGGGIGGGCRAGSGAWLGAGVWWCVLGRRTTGNRWHAGRQIIASMSKAGW